MLFNKLLDVKVPTLFNDHNQGTIKTEWPAYLFILVLGIIALFIIPIISFIIHISCLI